MNDLLDKKETMRRIIGQILEVNPSQIRDDFEFATELSVDSLSLLEIALKIEAVFGVVIPDADYPRLTSLNKIMFRVEELQALHKSSATVSS